MQQLLNVMDPSSGVPKDIGQGLRKHMNAKFKTSILNKRRNTKTVPNNGDKPIHVVVNGIRAGVVRTRELQGRNIRKELDGDAFNGLEILAEVASKMPKLPSNNEKVSSELLSKVTSNTIDTNRIIADSKVVAYSVYKPEASAAPYGIKLSACNRDICLSWLPFQSTSDEDIYYNVYIAVKKSTQDQDGNGTLSATTSLSLLKVYSGWENACHIPTSQIDEAYINETTNDSMFFKISSIYNQGEEYAVQGWWFLPDKPRPRKTYPGAKKKKL